jgi:hypothetical protein
MQKSSISFGIWGVSEAVREILGSGGVQERL